jgi:hypothetical protein
MFKFGYNDRRDGLFANLGDPMGIGAIARRAVPTAAEPEEEERRRRGSGLLSNLGMRIFGDDNRFFGTQEDGTTFRDRMLMAGLSLQGDSQGALAVRQGIQDQRAAQAEAQQAASAEGETVRRAFALARTLGEQNPDMRRQYLNGAMANPQAFLDNYAATFEPTNLSEAQTRYNPYNPSGSYQAAEMFQQDGLYGTQRPDGVQITGEDQATREGIQLGNANIRSQIADRAADNRRADAEIERARGAGQRDREDALRSEYGSVAEDYQDLLRQYDVAETAYAQDNAVGDLQLVVAFTKALDPGSVAREGEVNLTQSAQSLVEQWRTQGRRLAEGGTRLGPQVREELIGAIRDLEDRDREAFTRQRSFYENIVEQDGLQADRVFNWEPREPRRDNDAQARADALGVTMEQVRQTARNRGLTEEDVLDRLESVGGR